MFQTSNRKDMHHHGYEDTIGGAFAIVSIIMYVLGRIDLNIEDVAAFLAVLSGSASLIINYPKLNKRIKEIIQKLKR